MKNQPPLTSGTFLSPFLFVSFSQIDFRKVMNGLDGFLKTRTFLVGERITLADVVVATTLLPGFKSVRSFIPVFFRKIFN